MWWLIEHWQLKPGALPSNLSNITAAISLPLAYLISLVTLNVLLHTLLTILGDSLSSHANSLACFVSPGQCDMGMGQ